MIIKLEIRRNLPTCSNPPNVAFAFSNPCSVFLVPCSIFSVHAGYRICSFCIPTFPTLKKRHHVTVITNHKANSLPMSSCLSAACSTVVDTPNRPTYWPYRDRAVSRFLKQHPQVPNVSEVPEN
uniref:Uncharacterized protein n=1 Tax=Arundo donax TaxID=35708 RepID=A0A0A9GU13_ARUDO